MALRGWTVDAPLVTVAAVATSTAGTGGIHRIADILYSYDVAPTGGSLKISDGTTDVEVAVVAAGAGRVPQHFLPFESPDQITVTLAGGGGGVTGKLNIMNRDKPAVR